jgi:hypothetical protein
VDAASLISGRAIRVGHYRRLTVTHGHSGRVDLRRSSIGKGRHDGKDGVETCIDLAVPGRPIGPWSRRTGAPEASATRQDAEPERGAWSTFGPHAIGTERFATVSSGASLRRSPMRSWGNRLGRRTLIKDEVPGSGRPPPGGHHLNRLSFVLLKLAVNGSVRTR